MSNATEEADRMADHGPERGAAGADGPSDAVGADRLDERLSAVERALTGTDATVADLGDGAAAAAEREAVASRVDELESRVEELEAATQAIRGYVGSIRAVNREVERRADLALARATRGEDVTRGVGTAGDDSFGDMDHDDHTPVDGVPSESALAAAVPSDDGRRTDGRSTLDRESAEDGDATGSWRDEALNRLRGSL